MASLEKIMLQGNAFECLKIKSSPPQKKQQQQCIYCKLSFFWEPEEIFFIYGPPNREWGLYGKISNRGLAVLTEVSLLASTLSKCQPRRLAFLCRFLPFRIIKLSVWMLFVAHFSICFLVLRQRNIFLNYFFRILSLFLFTVHKINLYNDLMSFQVIPCL